MRYRFSKKDFPCQFDLFNISPPCYTIYYLNTSQVYIHVHNHTYCEVIKTRTVNPMLTQIPKHWKLKNKQF